MSQRHGGCTKKCRLTEHFDDNTHHRYMFFEKASRSGLISDSDPKNLTSGTLSEMDGPRGKKRKIKADRQRGRPTRRHAEREAGRQAGREGGR